MIKPIFDFDNTLYSGECKIVYENSEYIGIAEIKYEFLPTDSIVIYAEFDSNNIVDFINKNPIDIDPDLIGFYINKQIDNKGMGFFIIDTNISSDLTKFVFKLVPREELTLQLNSSKEVTTIYFHLFNFYNLDFKNKLENNNRFDELILKYREYKITIQSLKETSKNIEAIKKTGVSKLTYVGKIEKEDKSSIPLGEYRNIDKLLTSFLSFIKGSKINPACIVGMNEKDEEVWSIFKEQKKPWKLLSSCFQPIIMKTNAEMLSELFSKFAQLWQKDTWDEILHEVIYWFLIANDGSRGIDAGLILSQTAIERLSFEYVVNSKKLILSKGFKDLWASDKFRLLFSSLNIPLDIPKELQNLTQEAKSQNWLDAPHALTEIRNSLVHPDHKKRGKFSIDIFSESHKLSLWYLEVSILAISGYKNFYSNRLKLGNIEYVPYK